MGLKTWAAVFHLINVVVESAFLVLPKTMKRSGIAVGIGLLCFISIMTYICYERLWYCFKLGERHNLYEAERGLQDARQGKPYNTYLISVNRGSFILNNGRKFRYEDLVFSILGTAGARSIALIMVVTNFIQSALYIRIGGDNVSFVVTHDKEFGYIFGLACTVVLIISFLMAYKEKIKALEKASVIAVFCALLIGGTIITRMFIHGTEKTRLARYDGTSGLTFFVYLFCFNWSTVIIPVLKEIEDSIYIEDLEKANNVIKRAISTALIIFISVAVCGYLHFGDEVEDNILDSYGFDLYSNILRVGISILMILSLPLYLMSLRANLKVIVNGVNPPDERPDDPSTPLYNIVFLKDVNVNKFKVSTIFTDLILLVLLMATALFTPDLHFLIMLTSSIAVPLLVLVFPSLCYMKLRKRYETVEFVENRDWSCMFFIIFGSIIFLIGIPAIIYDEIH